MGKRRLTTKQDTGDGPAPDDGVANAEAGRTPAAGRARAAKSPRRDAAGRTAHSARAKEAAHGEDSRAAHGDDAPAADGTSAPASGGGAAVAGATVTPRRALSGDEARRVFESLRNAVLDQRLPPGLQLKEQALADAFGVNRAVIRQVLAKLEIYRLVTHEPNRGVFVAHPSADEGRDIFTARRYVEAAIVELAVERLRAADFTRLRALVRREQQTYASGELRKALRLSIDFHLKLAAAVGNEVLTSFLDELVTRTPLVVLAHRREPASSCALNEHALILDAIEARDAERAKALMTEHIGHLEGRLALGRAPAHGEPSIARLLGLPSEAGER
ncbi:MAG TPA: GntR family transcriptional regulator [Rhodocyclaceae bacterium]|nr:GntR family transcriptional regulator [Rhodocyclaceae bacterium]